LADSGQLKADSQTNRNSTSVASKSKIAKAKSTPKFSTRRENRCKLCGRPRAVYRKFGICRICFRKLADQGLIPGVRNASW
jgi:small subunit ribosomal protein S14